MIRARDLQPGNVLQHRDGHRVRLSARYSECACWLAERLDTGEQVVVSCVDIGRTGEQRIWWLDE